MVGKQNCKLIIHYNKPAFGGNVSLVSCLLYINLTINIETMSCV